MSTSPANLSQTDIPELLYNEGDTEDEASVSFAPLLKNGVQIVEELFDENQRRTSISYNNGTHHDFTYDTATPTIMVECCGKEKTLARIEPRQPKDSDEESI